MSLFATIGHQLRLNGRKVSRAMRRDGLLGTSKLVALNCWYLTTSAFSRSKPRSSVDIFDAEWGVRTAGVVEQSELDVDSSHHLQAIRYQPTPPAKFHLMMKTFDINYLEYTFVDIGSGKGRALLLAAQYPFRAIVGVEFSSDLCEIAEANIEACRARLPACQNLTSVCEDATLFQLPETPLVLYFYHPFEQPVMDLVIANIRESVIRHPRRIVIIYYNPVCGPSLEKNELFVALHRGEDFAIYSNQK